MDRCEIDTQGDRFRICLPCWSWVVGVVFLVAAWATTASMAAPSAYRLAPGDRLSIVVFGHSDLSGDFTVDGNGQISLPIAGPVIVGELTVSEAQERIQASFADGVLVQPTIAVRILEQRPVYIVGDVRSPGTYPFRFGQSVTTAIAMAGGPGRATDQQNVAMFEFLSADERVRVLELTQRSLLVRRARLEAQLAKSPEFVLPSIPGVKGNDPDINAIWTDEKEIFNTLMQAHDKQIAALRRQPPLLQAEIKALTEQIAKERENLDLAKKRIGEAEPLTRAGVLRRHVLLDRQREAVSIESHILQLTAQIARLNQAIGDINIRIDEAEVAYQRQFMADLQDASQRLRELEVTLATAHELRDLRAQYAGGVDGIEPAHTVTIVRTRTSGVTKFQATAETLIEPGDVIDVRRQRQHQRLHKPLDLTQAPGRGSSH